MTADLYLLAHCRETETVFIRFYGWSPPAISLGYRENPASTLDFDALRKDKVDWIRRATGGRAVLHWEDITYSVIFSRAIAAMGNSVSRTYNLICRCLQEGLKRCGVTSTSHNSAPDIARERSAVRLPCFLAPNRDEIMVDGKKLVGSAQKRTADAVLQHGSIPWTGAYRRLPDYLALAQQKRESQKRLLARKCTSIREIAPGSSQNKVIDSLIEGFCAVLPFEYDEKAWTENEKKEIKEKCAGSTFLNKWKLSSHDIPEKTE
ncbi:MAG: hypothetical protein GF350_10135 [Chitinivibrionales bacterium]|nr:hypothetical protein [Chitinivibrionales bacterium]